MKSVEKANVSGKRVLVRVDFNVLPLTSREIRIEKTLPTLRYLLSRKAKIILLTHLETNNWKIPGTKILLPYLKRILPMDKIILFENLRKFPGEKKNDLKFAKRLASLGDIYVNEAFSASHRPHASIISLPKLLPSYAGFLFEEEIKKLSKVFKPHRPFTLVLGGGKIETKLPILNKFLPVLDYALLGGVLLNRYIMEKNPLPSKKVILPTQVIASGKKIMDVAPEGFGEWERIIKSSKLIVWNGPLGYMEKGYTSGTRKLISILQKIKGEVIIGGGDTLDYLPPKLPKNIFVSTGGGAMLEYLVHKTLPGITALEKGESRQRRKATN